MDGVLKEKVLSSFVWQLLQRVLTQLISFCVSVVLARMLAPEDFGVVALSGMLIQSSYKQDYLFHLNEQR